MKLFSGLYTALVTPFCDGTFDRVSFERLLETQKDADGIVIGGTTGESPTITAEELNQEIAVAREHFKGKIIVGAGSNNTEAAIKKINILDQQAGIDGYLVVAPYYNRPNAMGIFEHYSAIAESTRRPIIMYSIPSRCGVEIALDTVINLVEENKNIVGIKEATDNCSRIDDFYRLLPEDFSIFSGNDNMTLPFMALGACGVISASANVLPQEMKKLVDLSAAGKFDEARAIHSKIVPLIRALFSEPNPIAIKYVLESFHILRSSEVRLPLYASSEEKLQQIAQQF